MRREVKRAGWGMGACPRQRKGVIIVESLTTTTRGKRAATIEERVIKRITDMGWRQSQAWSLHL